MNNLRAAFVLTLEDKLSAGFQRIRGEMDQLRQLGGKLGLGKLGEGVNTLRAVGREVVALTRNFHSLGAVVDRTWSRMKQMAAAPIARVKQAFSAEGKLGALGSAAQGYSVVAPIHTYADFQDIALRAAITEGLSGKAANTEANSLMTFFRRDARDTGGSSTQIADAFLDLIQTGMAPALAKALLPIHSKAATAYGIDPEALGHAVFALADTLKIGEKDMGGALAAMALAAQKGRFKIEDFSRFLPGITGNMAKLGMSGRGSADVGFAMLETVMRNSSDPSSGATNFTDFMNYLTSPMAARSFSLESKGMSPITRKLLDKYHITGIDMPAVLADARKKGMNPLEAVMGTLQAKVRGLPPDVMAEVLGAFFHNQQARDAAVALLLHSGEYSGLKQQLGGVKAGKLDTDFNTRMGGAAVQTKQFSEALSELGQTLGRGFLPILLLTNHGLSHLLDALDWLDAKFPGVESAVLLVVGGMLTLGAVISAVGFVLPAFIAGWDLLAGAFGLLMMPLRWVLLVLNGVVDAIAAVLGISAGLVAAILVVAAVFAAAAYDIYENWGEFAGFFQAMWDGIKNVFGGFADFVTGVFNGDMSAAMAGLQRIWSGMGEYYVALWGIVRQLFIDFGSWVDGWTGGAMTASVNAIKAAWNGLAGWFASLWAEIRAPFDSFIGDVEGSWAGRLLHLNGAPQLQGPGSAGGQAAGAPALSGPRQEPFVGRITVGIDPATNQLRVQHATSSSSNVSVLPDPGQVLGIQ